MNPQENQDYKRKLQELEAQLDKERSFESVETQPSPNLQKPVNHSQPEKSVFNQVTNWFNSLPSAGKVAVAAIAALIGFSILRTVLQLVASLFSLALLGVILYLVYKFFVTPRSAK
jgi:uncharacterized membrane protein YcjF (UPF0283 family)